METLVSWKKLLQANKVTPLEILEHYYQNYQKDLEQEKPINAVIQWFDQAWEKAKKIDPIAARSGALLEGLPLMVKDNILVQGQIASCASRILENFVSPYSATVVKCLENQGAIIAGRTNMDEFAMGSSCEHSIYGVTRNPHNPNYICGGSSGGSAAAVAADHIPVALGSDTGGSVRLPASFCGVYGLKPSYGLLSRYGLVAYSSRLDQIGFMAHCPDDLAMLLQSSCHYDALDQSMNQDELLKDIVHWEKDQLHWKQWKPKHKKILVISELAENASEAVQKAMNTFCQFLKKQGYQIEFKKVPIFLNSLEIYYAISCTEAMSNLARYDGIRYGKVYMGNDLDEVYHSSRSQGLGQEVQKRIVLGTYLASSYSDNSYYQKSLQALNVLKAKIKQIYEEYDFILTPVNQQEPFLIGTHTNDSLTMAKTDSSTVFSNLVSGGALSIPVDKTEHHLPIGLQLACQPYQDLGLLTLAKQWFQEGKVE